MSHEKEIAGLRRESWHEEMCAKAREHRDESVFVSHLGPEADADTLIKNLRFMSFCAGYEAARLAERRKMLEFVKKLEQKVLHDEAERIIAGEKLEHAIIRAEFILKSVNIYEENRWRVVVDLMKEAREEMTKPSDKAEGE